MGVRSLVLGTVAAIVLVAVVMAGGRVLESQPTFCASCHEEKVNYENWRASGAAEDHPNCIECHTGAGLAGIVNGQARGLVHVYKHFTSNFSTPLQAVVPDSFCIKCHEPARVEREHREVARDSKPCAECHNHKPGASFKGEENERGRGEQQGRVEGGTPDRGGGDDD